MVKQPRAGAVKTRLARDIGPARAAAFYRNLALATVGRLAGDPRWTTVLAVAPDRAAGDAPWPPRVPAVGQGTGDLGTRMDRLMRQLPCGPVVIIGTDVPGITRQDIAGAFRLLGSHDAVFGPAPDGGYWLVGQRRRPRVLRMFDNVRWSSRHALEDTLANLEGRRVAFVAERDDIDTAEDLDRYRKNDPARP